MKFDRDFARELCAQLGIEWDGQSSVPTLRGAALDKDGFSALFTPAVPFSYGANVLARAHNDGYHYQCSGEDLKCA